MSRRVAALSAGVVAMMLVSLPAASWARTIFRKCDFKVMVEGQGLGRHEVPGARFSAWARMKTGKNKSRAKRRIHQVIREARDTCLRRAYHVGQPWRGARPPKPCLADGSVHQRKPGYGVSGFRLAKAMQNLKRFICKTHTVPNARSRSIQDRRVIDGFRVYAQKVGGNGSCPTKDIHGPGELTIDCNVKPHPTAGPRPDKRPMHWVHDGSR